MGNEDKRRSARVIPFVSDEEVVVIRLDEGKTVLGKMLDLSEVGTLVYLLADVSELPGDAGLSCVLSMYHDKKIFDMPATLVRKNSHLVAFEFVSGAAEAQRNGVTVGPIRDLAGHYHRTRILLASGLDRHLEVNLFAPGQRRG